ncbi:MAG: hypothetical protein WAM26_03105 [Nitrososphaeraceae archaeon]
MENGVSKRENELSSHPSSDTRFQDYMTDTLNKGMLAIMLSIGHKVSPVLIYHVRGEVKGKLVSPRIRTGTTIIRGFHFHYYPHRPPQCGPKKDGRFSGLL